MSYLTRGRASKTLKLAKKRREKEGAKRKEKDEKVRKIRDYVRT